MLTAYYNVKWIERRSLLIERHSLRTERPSLQTQRPSLWTQRFSLRTESETDLKHCDCKLY